MADRLEITEAILSTLREENPITVSELYRRVEEKLSPQRMRQFPFSATSSIKLPTEEVLKYLIKRRLVKLSIDEEDLAIMVGISTSKRVTGFSNRVQQLAAIGK